MTKPFASCDLPDLVYEIFLDARAAAAQLLPRLADAEATEAALQRHPLVRGASGLECTGTAESEQAWCSMLRDLFSASGAAVSDAALLRVYLVCRQCCGRGRVRVCAFITRIMSHPAAAAAGHELLAHLTAHPVRCLASQLNVQRWRAMLRCHTPSPAHAPHWHATGIHVGQKQRRAVLCGGALLRVLVPRLLCVQGEYGVVYPLNLARRIASRRHFLGSKLHQAEGVFEEGQRLYGEQRFSEAAERWGRAALLQHGPSHAHLSDMLISSKPGVALDKKRAFTLASAGAALGCAHSKGALGLCYAYGFGVAEDEARGLALGRESAAAGSCFGQNVVGRCYEFGGGGVAQDNAEAVRLYRLAAAQGDASAQYNLGYMIEKGYGVAQDTAEAIRWYRLAAEQGHAGAPYRLGCLCEKCDGVAQDTAEAIRWYRLAAEQGNKLAQKRLGKLGSVSRSAGTKTEFEGKQYDHVLPVAVGEDAPTLKIAFNNNDDPSAVAQAFTRRHGLHGYGLEQIVDFVKSAQQPVALAAARSSFPCGSTLPSPAPPPSAAIVPKLMAKISQFNAELAVTRQLQLTAQELNGLEVRASPAGQSCNCSHVSQELLLTGTFSEDCRDAIIKGMQWPHAMAFPILDVLRSAAIKSPSWSPVQFLFLAPFTCLCHPYGASLIFPFRCQRSIRSQSANWRQVDQFYSSYCQSRLCIGWFVRRQQPFDEFALLQQSSHAVWLALSSCN
jgi:TPR repeat protein